jgi:hypothetical protein
MYIHYMKITNDIIDVMDVLHTEFSYRKARQRRPILGIGPRWSSQAIGSDGMCGAYTNQIMETLNMSVNDFLYIIGGTECSGANTAAVVTPSVTIKWNTENGIASHYATDKDAMFYQEVVEQCPEYGMYLAETIQYGQFTVQETIRPAVSVLEDTDIDTDDDTNDIRFDIYATLVRVAHELGLRDVHMGNWGFRDNDLTTPVIFDFSDRREPGSYTRWDRLNTQFAWIGRDYDLISDYEDALQNILDSLNRHLPDDDVGDMDRTSPIFSW